MTGCAMKPQLSLNVQTETPCLKKHRLCKKQAFVLQFEMAIENPVPPIIPVDYNPFEPR
jgi:hypothetical protein